MSPVPPVSGPVTAGYPKYPSGKPHNGIDFGVPDGTPVRANRAGTITRADYDTNIPSYGLHVREGVGNLELIYGHMSRLVVKRGQHVSEGQVIGYSGHTGNATGPHVHFGVKVNGGYVNPVPYLTGGSSGSSGGGLGAVIGATVGVLPGMGAISAFGAVDKLGGAALDAGAGVLGGLDAMGSFFGALGQRNTWIRVLQVVGGAGLVVVGVVIVGRGVVGSVAVQAIPGGPAIKAAAGGLK